jgi:hypothetical protein
MYRACTGIIPLRDLSYIDDPREHASKKAMMIAISFVSYLARVLLAMMIAISRSYRWGCFFLNRCASLRLIARRASPRDSKMGANARRWDCQRPIKLLIEFSSRARGSSVVGSEKTG